MMLDSRPSFLGGHIACRGDGRQSEGLRRKEPGEYAHRKEAYHR
jgi:hypothetical protein